MSQADLITTCLEELEHKSKMHRSAWQLGEEMSWSIDQEKKTIIFYFADGKKVSAPVQIIGTYDISQKTMRWAWANQSIHEDLSLHSQLLREVGLKGKNDILLQELAPMSEHQAWLFTALVVKMKNSYGAYRGQIKDSYIYMTFGSIFCDYEEGLRDQFSQQTLTHASDGEEVVRKDLVNFIQSYFQQLYEIEKAFNNNKNKNAPNDYKALVDASLAQMNDLYDQYWQRNDDFHKPCAVSWPSDYDLSQTRKWRVYDLDGEIFRITYLVCQRVERCNSLYLKVVGDEIKIIDFQYDSCDMLRDKPVS